MVSKLALGAIWGYQQFLSPRKGYRCAYSVLHGGTGCSGFAKHAIRDHGLWGAVPHMRERFRDCKEASRALRARCIVHAQSLDDQNDEQGGAPTSRGKSKKGKDGVCAGSACFGLELALAGCVPACAAGSSSGQSSTGGGDSASGSDCATPECGSMPDCSIPDCGGCDCAPSCG